MLGMSENDRQLIVASRSGDRVDNPRHTLVPVVRFSRSSGERAILQEKWLISKEALFKEMGLPGLILLAKTVLMGDGIKLFLNLGGDVEI